MKNYADNDDDDAVKNPHTKNIWLRIAKFGTIALKFQRIRYCIIFRAHIAYTWSTYSYGKRRQSKKRALNPTQFLHMMMCVFQKFICSFLKMRFLVDPFKYTNIERSILFPVNQL